MTDLEVVREALGNQFHNVTEVEDDVLRGERVYGDKRYAVAFFDFRDDVIGRAQELGSFQERLIGAEYFDSPEQLRWSSYLYVVAGPKSLETKGFEQAKATIEANRDYTRKFVLSSDEMLLLLSDSPLFSAEEDVETTDVTNTWADHLTTHHLNTLLDKPARSKAIELIEKGQASRKVVKQKSYELNTKDMTLTKGFLRSLQVGAFRPVHDGKSFGFADVNLIVGPNGSGKTSLLEAIEYLYCGHNRRDDAHGHYNLSGMIQPATGDKLEPISSTTDASRLKARNFVWYRKENHQSKSILDGFTKYNFLDTDAAFRLSTDLEPTALIDDLRRLLVGGDASTLWDYLAKVTDELESRTKDLRREVSFVTVRCEELKKEVERVLQAPSQASSLSKTFRAALRELGWKGKEAHVDEVVNENERPSIEAIANSLKRIRSALATSHITRGILRSRLHDLKQLRDSASTSETKRIRIAGDLVKRSIELIQTEQTSTLLAEWFTYCGADAPRLINAINIGREDVRKYQKQLGTMATTSVPRLPDEFANLALDDVAALVTAGVTSAHEEVRTAEIAQRNIESLQQSLSLLRRQLQEAARQILSRTGQGGLCPVCNTLHSPEILHSKIEALSGGEPQPEIAELASRMQTAKSREAGLVQLESDIKTLRKMAASLDLSPSNARASEIRNLLVSQQKKLAESVEMLRTTEEAVTNFDLIGMSVGRYMELRPIIEALFEEGSDIESLAVLDSTKQKFISKVENLRQQLIQLNGEMKVVSTELQKLFLQASMSSNSSANVEVDTIFKTIDEELQQIQRADNLLEQIGQNIELTDDQSISDFEIAITSATEAFDRAWHAVQTDLATNQTQVKVKHDHETSITDLKNKKEKLQRLKDAHSALNTLRTEYSLSNATDKVLTTVRDQINDVFGRIHSPREYLFSNSSNALLVTRVGNKVRTLEQVSTGQRAAFALSIFLALNSTARSAPPIVLIDDPIAHIDDLNALSFLDYLRDLALHTRRQIFFATADTRVAALFDKKFSFLGQTRYKRLQLSPLTT